MKKIFIINGPSINLTGKREIKIYGECSYNDIIKKIKFYGKENSVKIKAYQSNSEGDIIDLIQKANKKAIGIVINPGAYSHYSYAIMDAIRSISIPTIEVHISDIFNREKFRSKLVTGSACEEIIAGKGTEGYFEAISHLLDK